MVLNPKRRETSYVGGKNRISIGKCKVQDSLKNEVHENEVENSQQYHTM